MFSKSFWGSRKSAKDDVQKKNDRQRMFLGTRLRGSMQQPVLTANSQTQDTTTPSSASVSRFGSTGMLFSQPRLSDVNRSSSTPISRMEYIRRLFERGITTTELPTAPTIDRTTTEAARVRAEILAAHTAKVDDFKVPTSEAEDLEARIKEEMKQGVEESKGSIWGDEDEEMDVDDGQQTALLAGREAILSEEDRLKLKSLLRPNSSDRTVVIDKFNIDITISKLSCLCPHSWLNDEIVNFYMCMLQERDTKLCAESNGQRRPSHYFNSFFMSKLLENGQYNYAFVRRWSKKVDVFAMERVFIPINLNNTHWAMSVVYVQKKEVYYYDSMCMNGQKYLDAIRRWLVDEAKDKKQITLDPNEWKFMQGTQNEVPQQRNGYDCGVFSIMCADYVSDALPLRYSQEGMGENRLKIAAAICRGHLLY